jgi:hypothetical protein
VVGAVVFWTIVRALLVIPLLWILLGLIEMEYWWTLVVLCVYGVVIHPAVIHYRLFEEKNREIIETTLCSSCRYFEKSAVLCMKFDKHPSKTFLPCKGFDWEMRPPDRTEEDEIIDEG